jgi:hypothetical protein
MIPSRQCRVVSFCRCAVRSLAVVLALALPAIAAAVEEQAVSGDAQVAVLGQPFPVPLSLRVLDDSGAPMPGAQVLMEVNSCLSIPEGPVCPEPGAYPKFADGNDFVDLVTDANGVVTAPQLFAGDLAGRYEMGAWATSGDPPTRSAPLFFTLFQAGAAVPITPAFSGAWYDPAQSGHGILIEVLPGNRLLAYWFAFTPDGTQQAWFGGVGDIAGNGATVSADRGQGGRWIPNFDPATFSLQRWGTLTFSFSDCDHGTVAFTAAEDAAEWSIGTMSLTRLTQPAGLACP